MTPDLLVVGGGPVGLAAALDATARGMRVVVVEPRPGPVDKACGEGLMPGAVAALDRLGVHPDGAPFAGLAYLSADGRRAARHAFRAGPGLGVRRTTLHAALTEKASAAGVVVRQARLVGLTRDGSGVTAGLDDGGELRASWLLGADGLHSTVRRCAGIAVRSDGRRFGLRRHAAVAPWSPDVEVHWAPHAEAYVTPVGPDEVGVALLLRGDGRRFEDVLDGFPALRERLAGAAWTSGLRGAGPLHQRVERRTAGRVLLVGDAAGYVDALTGEGVRLGLATAAAALDAVAADDAASYEARWRRATRRYRWLTGAVLAGTGRAGPRRALLPAARALPGVFGAACEALAS